MSDAMQRSWSGDSAGRMCETCAMRTAYRKAVWLALVLICLPSCGKTQSADAPKNRQPWAVVNGQPIYEDDLPPRLGSDLQRLRNQEYQIKQRALQSFILEKLWRTDAEKLGLTPEEYLEKEIDAKAAQPTEEEIAAQYQLQKDQLKKPFAEVKEQLRDSLRQASVRQLRREYFTRLWESPGVKVLLEPPRVAVAHDPARVRGNPKAPVVIVEFSDYQCPYCRRVQPTLLALLARYKDQVALAYLDYPLREIHPQAQLAAEAARCAGDQGKFWEYHDLLFAQTALQREALNANAQRLGLEMQKFDACLSTGKYRDGVEADFQAGARAGVGGTPAFFINGVFLDGAQSQAEFEKVIDAELKRKGSLP
jgi:predicted DsbA family dithiol-disulfide isomerase